jgi:FixJ family two-component response regulator
LFYDADHSGDYEMIPSDHVVFAVDDDPRIGEALSELLSAMYFHVVVCTSASEYLRTPKPDLPTCLILDVNLPDINGLDLQASLGDHIRPAIVFITGHRDISSSVKAMKAGAVDFLPKPFDRNQLIAAVREALVADAKARAARAEIAQLQKRFSLLTRRESEVLPWLVAGYLNKQAAGELGISGVTLQIHRGQIMRKMGVGSLAELVRMSSKLQIALPEEKYPPHMKSL